MESIPFEFSSAANCVRGRYFAAGSSPRAPVFLYLPGWPGEPGDGFMDLYPRLAGQGIHVFMFNPRGLSPSEGMYSHANTLEDIASAIQWLGRADVRKRFGVDPARLSLGGHSFGGGISMAYAARDPTVRRVVSIAGPDFAELGREIQRNAAFAEAFRSSMSKTRSPLGPARFDLEEGIRDFIDHPDIYGQKENAARLADRSILLIGGWEDQAVTIEAFLLPVYRALRQAGANAVTVQMYHTDHEFRNVRQQLAEAIAGWLQQQ